MHRSLKWHSAGLKHRSEFETQSCYYVHFRMITLDKGMSYLILPSNGLNSTNTILLETCPVGWGSRIHRLIFYRGVRPPNECPESDTKQSNGETPVMLWGMRSTPLLPSLPGPLWPGVVAPDSVLYICQIEQFLVLKLYLCWTKLFEIELFIRIKMDLVFYNLQWLIFHKFKPKQILLQEGRWH